jgi:hypothetical protein
LNDVELSFPVVFDPDDPFSEPIFLPMSLAKPVIKYPAAMGSHQQQRHGDDEVPIEEDGVLVSSPGVSLLYVLDGSTPEKLAQLVPHMQACTHVL